MNFLGTVSAALRNELVCGTPEYLHLITGSLKPVAPGTAEVSCGSCGLLKSSLHVTSHQ